MKRIFTLVGIAVCSLVQAQMTIRPNSYVFANNTVLYVDQGIDIQANGNLYLRREAQLMQNRTKTASTNSGVGTLSVFQEGTSDEFDYNYWCAPVGLADATNGNRPFSIALLHRPTTLTASTAAAITTGLNGMSMPLTISSYWIWTFVSSTTYSQWVQAGSGNIAPGLGFTMKGTDGTDNTNIYGDGVLNQNNGAGQRYDFRGRPNDGNISVNVAAGNWTLTGNPYPSALFVDAFLLDPDNTEITAAAYYWEHNKAIDSHFLTDYEGGYGTYVPGTIAPGDGAYSSAFIATYNPDGSVDLPGAIQTGLSIQRDYAPIGQGFMVEALTSGTVTLKNSHREYYREGLPLTGFERQADKGEEALVTVSEDPRLPQLRINAQIGNIGYRELVLLLVPYATDGVDRGFDGKSPNGDELSRDVAFKLDNEKYVIQGVAFDVTKRLPLIVKSTDNTTFKFTLPHVINFDETQDVFIYDAADNSYHPISNGGTYQVTLPTGTYANRFEVTFQDSALGVPTVKADSMSIVQNNETQQFTISNPRGLELKSCTLYDMAGRLVMNKEKLGSLPQYDFTTQGLSEAVYIVKVVTSDNQDYGQKISVHRTRQ